MSKESERSRFPFAWLFKTQSLGSTPTNPVGPPGIRSVEPERKDPPMPQQSTIASQKPIRRNLSDIQPHYETDQELGPPGGPALVPGNPIYADLSHIQGHYETNLEPERHSLNASSAREWVPQPPPDDGSLLSSNDKSLPPPYQPTQGAVRTVMQPMATQAASSASQISAYSEELTKLWSVRSKDFFNTVYEILKEGHIKPSELGEILKDLKVPFNLFDAMDNPNRNFHNFYLSKLKDNLEGEWKGCADIPTAQKLLKLSFDFAELLKCGTSPGYATSTALMVNKELWDKKLLGEKDVMAVLNYCINLDAFNEAIHFIITRIPEGHERNKIEEGIWNQFTPTIACPNGELTKAVLGDWAKRLGDKNKDTKCIPPQHYRDYDEMMTTEIMPKFIDATSQLLDAGEITAPEALGLLTRSTISRIEGSFEKRYQLYKVIEGKLFGGDVEVKAYRPLGVYSRENIQDPLVRLCHMYALERSKPCRAQLDRIKNHPETSYHVKEKIFGIERTMNNARSR